MAKFVTNVLHHIKLVNQVDCYSSSRIVDEFQYLNADIYVHAHLESDVEDTTGARSDLQSI